MKKFILPALFAVALGFTSCGDDENEDIASNCKECEILGIKTTLCDIGDGKVETTVSFLNESESEVSELPEGMTFEEYAETACGGLSIGR